MKGLKKKFVLIITLICFFSILLCSGISYYVSYNLALDISKKQSMEIVAKFSERFDRWISLQGEVLKSIATDLNYFKITNPMEIKKFLAEK